jgi:hypothetical protein
MATFQSRIGRWSRFNNNPEAVRRRSTAREEAIAALPAPAYPPDVPLQGDWVGGRVNGHTVIFDLARLPWHRSDQWAAACDGEAVHEGAGLVLLLELLRKRFGKAPSRRELAGMLDEWRDVASI